MKKRNLLSLFSLAMILLTSCQSGQIKVDPNKKSYVVGISQLVTHFALDDATKGFKDSLTSELEREGRSVKFIDTNSQGESSLCTISAASLVSKNVDLIMANATAAFQGAVNTTRTIPIVGTSITSYEMAIGRKINDNVIGTNATGTTDLAPLYEQAKMIFDIVPKVKNIGLLYCSSEPNSHYQIDEVEKHIADIAKDRNVEVKTTRYPFVDSNEVEQISRKAALSSDAIYVPTDNTVASCAKTICNATKNNGDRTPIICGDEGSCIHTGVATLTISYYDLGVTTGVMAADILLGRKKVEEMAIRPADKNTKKFNKTMCEESKIEIDERFNDYVAIN